jgi:hypothetical protein
LIVALVVVVDRVIIPLNVVVAIAVVVVVAVTSEPTFKFVRLGTRSGSVVVVRAVLPQAFARPRSILVSPKDMSVPDAATG